MSAVEPFSEAYPLPSPAFERRLLEAVINLRTAALTLERSATSDLERVHIENALGARNLLHYLAVRQHDVRELQLDLASLGLSSLGRLEKCVLFTLERVAYALARLDNTEWRPEASSSASDPARAQSTLAHNTAKLLGPEPKTRSSRIMVTLATDMDVDELALLLERGMNVARINCAKGGSADWAQLLNTLDRARQQLGVPCSVQFDLAGPNPRSRLFGASRKQLPAHSGGRVALVSDADAAHAARKEHKKATIIGCTLPEVVACLRVGERFLYDNGSLQGHVTALGPGVAWLEVTHCSKPELQLKPEKGLNFPDSTLALPSLTQKDLEDLEFVADHADIIALSFVRAPKDVEAVQEYLASRGRSNVGLMLKIETQQAFNQLAKLLLVALRSPKVGLMVARGDMAAELGFLRLAEAQEEVLWLAEAALVPVVWATQVLECMTKTGVPSRAEVTDSAMAGRAEAVMLNRGRYVPESVAFLDDVLRRMQAHQDKKRSLLRRLQISELPLAE